MTPTPSQEPFDRPSRLQFAEPSKERRSTGAFRRRTEHSALTRRWTINGDFLGLKPTGVARYAREVTLALDWLIGEGHPLARDLEIDLVAPCEGDGGLSLDWIAKRIVPEFRRPRLPQVWVQMQLPRHVPGGLVSFCNLAPVSVSRQVVCIHDLHTRLMPESYGFGFRLAHRAVLPLLGRRVAAITTVSELSRQHLAQYGIAPASRITVTYNGADHATRWNASSSALIAAPSRPYVLALGRPQAYKNTGLVLKLAGALEAMGLDLWMAGDVDADFIRAQAGRMPANLLLLGRVDDNDFASALSSALCFVFPSRIEGFGLPAVEAMTLGCPVIASFAPCLPEVCADAALYADPDEPASWLAAIERLRNEHGLRAAMIEKGRARAARYTWRGIAETYLTIMRKVDDELPVAHRRHS
ncbi:glycosyltransferase family 4 protein [Pararhizobium haloflavum]|uniref:glycosyltransferase family 4 protein n=1 Tax=Pararhizobium haloflavum TaxID=2037914 RepID=UPI001FDFFB71|nr:glycosyltransferase family 1 protein [Pararhizobium haloflavum]